MHPVTTNRGAPPPDDAHRRTIELSLTPPIGREFQEIADRYAMDPAHLVSQIVTDYVLRQRQLADGAGSLREADHAADQAASIAKLAARGDGSGS